MENRYTGDVGDFGKYGLLRSLCTDDEHGLTLKLGVLWCLVPDEGHNFDGKHVAYLENTPKNRRTFRECDPELWDALRPIGLGEDRHIRLIQESEILPPGTICHDESLAWPTSPRFLSAALRESRIEQRAAWHRRGLEMTMDCDIVFFDPDNGLDTKIRPYAKKGPKYAFLDEVRPYCERGQSVVVYQHMGRSGKAEDQIRRRLRQLMEISGYSDSLALMYHRGTARAFLIIPVKKHGEILRRRVKWMLAGPWGGHFNPVCL